jgi:hypothetical protein
MERGFATHDDVVVDRVVYANWNSEEAEKLARGYLRWTDRSGIVPAGVWSANDPIAFGAMRAFEEAGLEAGEDAFFVGLNWSRDALEAILADRMEMTDGGHFLAGGWSMVMLRDHADGVDFAENDWRQRFAMSALNAGLAERFTATFGAQEWDVIDFGRFRREPGGEYDFSLQALLDAVDGGGGT